MYSTIRKGAILGLLLSNIVVAQTERYIGPSGTDTGDCTSMGSPCASFSYAQGQALAGDNINFLAGTYDESLTVSKSLNILGANQGIPGNSVSRGSESIIETSSRSVAINIASDNVQIDGLQIGVSNISVGISSVGFTGLTVSNNVINSDSIGLVTASSTSGVISIDNNDITLNDFETPNTNDVTSCIALSGHTGTSDINISNNELFGSAQGVFVFDCVSSNVLTLSNDTITSSIRGATIASYDGSSRAPSTVDISGMYVHSFSEPVGGITNFPQTGVYTYSDGSSTDSHLLTVSISGSRFDGIGKTSSDYAGIIVGDFSPDISNDVQDVTISECTLINNLNRGIYVRGANTTASITSCIFSNNGTDPVITDGNPGFNLVVREGAVVTMTNSFLRNPASSPDFDGLSLDNSSLTISNCSFDQNGTGLIAGTIGINLSGNYFGTTDEATIQSFVGNNDYTPWLGSGTDTEAGTPGFQGDFSDLHIGLGGVQTGSDDRTVEGYNALLTGGTMTMNLSDYSESLTVSKNLTLSPASTGSDTVSIDDLTINGTGVTLQINGNLRINNSLSTSLGIIETINDAQLILSPLATPPTESLSSYVDGVLSLEPRNVGTGSIAILGVSIASGTDDLGDVTISRSMGTGSIITDGPYTSISIFWSITADNQPVSGRNISFSWLSTFDNGKNLAMISFFRNAGSGWVEVDGPQDISGSGDPRTYSITGVTQFSDWTGGQDDQPLPVELVEFSGSSTLGRIILEWTTAVEINSDHFIVERSIDQKSFSEIGRLQSSGNTSSVRNYFFEDTDISTLGELVFYRLKMVDRDETFEYSKTILVRIEGIDTEMILFPNPTREILFVDLAEDETILKVQVSNLMGQTKELNFQGNTIDVATLQPALHLISVRTQKRTLLGRFIKSH